MLSFDEFHAEQQRQRAKKGKEVRTGDQAKRGNLGGSGANSVTNKSAPELQKTVPGTEDGQPVIQSITPYGFGDFLESHQMQSFLVFMIVLDTFASFVEIYLRSDTKLLDGDSSAIRQLILNSIQSLTGFTLLFFSFEILAMLLVFKLSFVGHLGYCFDFSIVATQMYLEANGAGRETRILNIFRYWRLIRLFSSLVNIERELHLATKAELEQKDDYVRRLETDNQRLELDVSKEKEAKSSVEELLQSYKEEVDTLNEALKIAAMDIADVAQADEDFSDLEEEYLEDGEEGPEGGNKGLSGITSTAAERNKNMETLLKLARKEAVTNTDDSSANTAKSGLTFLVHEDGTFERR